MIRFKKKIALPVFMSALLIVLTLTGSSAGNKFGAYYTRLPMDDNHTGKYADIVVRLDAIGGEIVFGRQSSYLPLWRNPHGEWYFDEVVPRKGDGKGVMPDALNKYSYARVIENTPERVVVHYRYMPDLNNVAPEDVVHEHFVILPNGKITRTIRMGTERLDDYNDPGNYLAQEFELRIEGIKQVSVTEGRLGKIEGGAIEGNPVKGDCAEALVAWWKFDEGLELRPYEDEFKTVESVFGSVCNISGHKAMWKAGVSGTSLAFDGYYSSVKLPAADAPEVSHGLTLDVWTVIGAYPFNTTAIVQQSNHIDAGYFLGLTTHGNVSFQLSLNSQMYDLTLDEKVPYYKWINIAATYDKSTGKMELYVDGTKKGTLDVPVSDITMNDSDVMIGVNNIKLKATDLVREDNNIPQILGIEGLIDEVKIFDKALTASEIEAAYQCMYPGEKIASNPDLLPRILPGETGPAESFGASYKTLQYHDLWDNMWRVDDYADIIVKFDELPTSVVFWRGTSYAPTWITENNIWMGDQSAEVGGPWGCAEHMADKQQRHSYARIVENTPARVVIHWRYSCADIGYIFELPNNWSDEYIVIYPDGTSIRKVEFHGEEEPTWHEPQLFSPPGKGPLDVIDEKAVYVADLDGQVKLLDFSDGPPENTLTTSSIELFNLKSEFKIYNIIPDGTQFQTTGWFNTEQSSHTPDPFAGPWNHFPVSQLLSDGRLVTAYDRMTSCALGEGLGVTEYNIGLYGFTDKSIESLIPLAKSWNYPAVATSVTGSTEPEYNNEERAYEFTAEAEEISFTLNALQAHPVANPVFVIHEWGNADAVVKINGRIVGDNLRQGHVITKNKDKLVIFIEEYAVNPFEIEISPAKE